MKLKLLAVSLTFCSCLAQAQEPPRGYGVAGKTTFGTCLEAVAIKEGQGAGEAFLKFIALPFTVIGCSVAGTAEVAVNWSADTEENSLRWKQPEQRTAEESQRLAELREQRGDRGMYGYGGWAGNGVQTYGTVYTPNGSYSVSRNGNQVFVDQVSKTK